MANLTDDELIARVLELGNEEYSCEHGACHHVRCLYEAAALAPDLAHRLQKANEKIRELTLLDDPVEFELVDDFIRPHCGTCRLPLISTHQIKLSNPLLFVYKCSECKKHFYVSGRGREVT